MQFMIPDTHINTVYNSLRTSKERLADYISGSHDGSPVDVVEEFKKRLDPNFGKK